MGTDFVFEVKCPLVWLTRDLRVLLDLSVPDFLKITSMSTCLLLKLLEIMNICASQKYVIFRCNIFLKELFRAAQ